MNINGISSLYGNMTSANIDKITAKQSEAEERRICELSEIAYSAATRAAEMLNGGYGIYEAFSVISEGLTDKPTSPHAFALKENFGRLMSFLSATASYDKIFFAQLFLECLSDMGVSLTEEDFLPSVHNSETFTYVKNPLADEAYDVFSQNFSDPRVKYSQNFASAVGGVVDGEFEYTLLPLEERGGTRLASVSDILFREELKIDSVTPVFGYDGFADMKYALVSKSFTVPDINEDDDRYLEIRLRADSSSDLSDMLLAVNAFGSRIYRINTVFFKDGKEDLPYYSMVFKNDGKSFLTFLTYLTLFYGSYTPIGIYKNLE